MFKSVHPEHILFLDIETVPAYATYDEVPENWKPLWEKKSQALIKKETDTPASVYTSAGFFAEFGKIICICVGYLKKAEGKEQFRMKAFSGHDEKLLLLEFTELMNRHFCGPAHRICAHNGKEFDFPWIARRMLVHGIELPELLNTSGKKPWETQFLDTMEMWKFGDYKNYTSLNVLAALFGIPTPKDDIDGSQVYKVYYEEKNLERIVTYCLKDVLTVAQILRKYRREALISAEAVVTI
jgi:3'-5' exonuclease